MTCGRAPAKSVVEVGECGLYVRWINGSERASRFMQAAAINRPQMTLLLSNGRDNSRTPLAGNCARRSCRRVSIDFAAVKSTRSGIRQ